MNYDVVLKIPEGDYNNPDVIFNLISYISKDKNNDALIGGYGFWPVTPNAAITEFSKIQNTGHEEPSQYIWHIIFSFTSITSQAAILSIANDIASLFIDKFCVFYGLHTQVPHKNHRGFHIHMAVLSSSYHLNGNRLDFEKMNQYVKEISAHLASRYGYSIKLEVNDVGKL